MNTAVEIRGGRSLVLFLFCIIFCWWGMSGKAYTQAITTEETINYLNTKFDGNCSFKLKKGEVIVTFFKNGEEYRIDRLALHELDPESVVYLAEEGAIVVYCRERSNDCLQREIKRLKKVDYYGRFNLVVKGMDAKSRNGVLAALVHLIKLEIFSDHERITPFE
jgi:hypothetical protein